MKIAISNVVVRARRGRLPGISPVILGGQLGEGVGHRKLAWT